MNTANRSAYAQVTSKYCRDLTKQLYSLYQLNLNSSFADRCESKFQILYNTASLGFQVKAIRLTGFAG